MAIKKFCFCWSLTFGVLYISIMNIIVSTYLSFLSTADSNFVVPDLIAYRTHLKDTDVNYFFYGVTCIVSFCAIFSVACLNQYLMVPLLLWDMMRVAFLATEIWVIFLNKDMDRPIFNNIVFIVVLLFCILIENSYEEELNRKRLNNSDGILGLEISLGVSSQSNQHRHMFLDPSHRSRAEDLYTRSYFRCLPKSTSSASGLAPPTYSQLMSTSARASEPPAAALSSTNVQRHPQGHPSMLKESPPPYRFCESLAYSEDPPPYSHSLHPLTITQNSNYI